VEVAEVSDLWKGSYSISLCADNVRWSFHISAEGFLFGVCLVWDSLENREKERKTILAPN
jgi:hypothetical protein